MLRIPAHPSIEQVTMTGLNAEPIMAVRVVDNIKQLWYDAVVVIAGGSSLRSFGGTFYKSTTKPNTEGAKDIRISSKQR